MRGHYTTTNKPCNYPTGHPSAEFPDTERTDYQHLPTVGNPQPDWSWQFANIRIFASDIVSYYPAYCHH